MKKIFIIGAVVSAIVLTGCSGGEQEGIPKETVTVTQEASPPSVDDGNVVMSDQEIYLNGLRSMGNPIIRVASDSDLLEMGYAVCDALESGFSVEDIIAYMAVEMAKNGQTSDTEVEAVGYIIGAASSALCSQYNNF